MIMELRSQAVRKLAPENDPLKIGMGWKVDDLAKPQIMVESTFGDSHPGSAHLDQFVKEAVQAVNTHGGKAARYFATDMCDGIAQGHDGINYSLPHRDAIVNLVEAQANATVYDGGVFIASCDKSMPAMLMSIGRLKDMSAIVVTGGLLMNFYTPVEIPGSLPQLTHADRLMLFGSCFATHIGMRLTNAKFRCDVNPYGVLYNPLSISAALREIVEGKRYAQDDLFFFRECWHSPMHHGDFSSSSVEETLRIINERIASAHNTVFNADCLLLTFGTAWVYEQKHTGRIVGNCHKQPEKEFTRRRLEVDEIVLDYTSLLSGLLARNLDLKVIFTVSPIRHVRDGLHANQLSKATLLLAVDRLQAAFPENVFYFPAYELVLDELRDYRFYAEDMVHPSEVAVQYVWERFSSACFSPETLQIIEESENIRRALAHKPFHPGSEEYKRFLGQIVLKIDRLNGKYPYLDFQKERELCHIRLKI